MIIIKIMIFIIFINSLILFNSVRIIEDVVIKSHEDDSNDDSEFMHACTIIVFLLIKFLYSLIHLLNHLL